MRILQVHNRHRERGGEDVVVEHERELLEAGGHEVVPYVVDNPATAGGSLAALAVAPWHRGAARRVVGAARAARPDVVHVHNTWFALSPAVLTALSAEGWPTVVTLHNFRTLCANGLLLRDGRICHTCVGSHPWHAVRYRCYRGSVPLSAVAAATIEVARRRGVWPRDVDRFLVLDEMMVPLLEQGGVPRARVTLRPNFVFDPGHRSRPPSAGHEVVLCGRLSEEKGVDVLLEAWQAASLPGLDLVVVGEGPLGDRLAARSVPGVTFVGPLDHGALLARLLAARALVFPSLCHEAGPLVPLEAAGAGLPLVLSQSVGMAGRAEAAGAAWTAPPGDVAAWVGALNELSDDRRVDEVGLAARRLYEERHSPPAALASLVAVYESVASGTVQNGAADPADEGGRRGPA
ncbi:MAG TPA: glycosyltransferase family 4 protein [Acidimicrobiales bacterium]|nr:glycosyltransferase family 4 protein [Acidimicrobiales bacterium]